MIEIFTSHFFTLLQVQDQSLTSRENMQVLTIICQFIIALSILNVWLLRYETIANDFKTFNLPNWLRNVLGLTKGILCIMLIAGIWIYQLAVAASIAIAILMVGAIITHVNAKHSFKKTFPAFGLCLIAVLVAWLSSYYKFKG